MIKLVQEYFSESAARFPNKDAICCEEIRITYSDAEAFSNAFAREIRAAGAPRASFIPFFMKKSVNSVLSILSILKADCAYVPIDVKSPAQRLLSILQATQTKVMVVDNESQAIAESLLEEKDRPILLNIDQFTPVDTAPIDYENLSIDIAYVLFTSGSTGTPKGVMIPHKAIIDYIDWCVEAFELTDKDIVGNHVPLYFDVSTYDIYTAFKAGSSLHLAHEELNAVLPALIRWIRDRNITSFSCVPSVLTLLLKSRRLKEDSFPELRHLMFAGEVLPPSVLREWMLKYPHVCFTNMYGPTEITVTCTQFVAQDVPTEDALAIPMGKARSNMELFLRTESGELSKRPGDKGELLVRGTSVAYGYLGDQEKTEKAFIQNPMHNTFHDPVYCTGDLVEIDEHGHFLFIGRIDNQIKHLGYRIELGEIEASLTAISEVIEGVVVFGKGPEDEGNEIGACVNLKDGFELKDLNEALRERLPNYMVPTRIKIHSDEFPRTPNGKYDRKIITKLVYENI